MSTSVNNNYYTPEQLKYLKELIEEAELSKRCLKQLPLIPAYHKGIKFLSKAGIQCDLCGSQAVAKIGDYSRPIQYARFVCPNGSFDEGHGIYGHFANIILN